MTTTATKPRGRKALSLAAVLAVGAGTLFASAMPAHAENIDTNKTGSIIIHKSTVPGNGNQNPDGSGTDPSGAGIAEVVFEYCKINGIDLIGGGNAAWDDLNAITPAQKLAAATKGVNVLGDYTLSDCQDAPATDAAGLSTIPNLNLGAYFLREVAAPDKVIKKAEPFIVTVPTPSINKGTGNGEWVYNVNVYPKNTVGEGPIKNIENQPTNGAILGAPIDYTVTQTVPALGNDKDGNPIPYNKFIMTDTLDSKLDPLANENVVVTVNGTPVTDFTATWDGQKLTTKLGDAALAALKAGDKVQVSFKAKANAVGTIDNTAYVNVNDLIIDGEPGEPGDPEEPGNPTNKVTTKWGQLQLLKVDQGNPAKTLEGAEFAVYQSKVTDNCGALTLGDMIPVKNADGSVYKATSDENGIINIPGLWVGDDGKLADGTQPNNLDQRCYVLVETKAPAGFILDADKQHEAIVKPGTMATVQFNIENKQQEVPELPLTGAAGTMIMVGGGLVLVLAGAGGVALNRRRQNA